MTKLGSYLLEKDAHAITAAFICALLPIFPIGFVFAALIVALVTLQKGIKAGFLILVWIVIPTLIFVMLQEINAYELLFACCVFVWIVASLFRKIGSWRLLLELLTLFAALIVVTLHLTIPQLVHWWVQQLTMHITEAEAAYKLKLKTTPGELANMFAPFMTGLVVFFFCVSAFVEVLLARFWQSAINATHSFAAEFVTIRVSRYAALIALVVFGFALFKNPIALDLLIITLMLLTFCGLSLLHVIARKNRFFVGMLVAAYVGLILLPGFFMCALAAVGFIDSWIDFRKRCELTC